MVSGSLRLALSAFCLQAGDLAGLRLRARAKD
jgi:hypothetical protein